MSSIMMSNVLNRLRLFGGVLSIAVVVVLIIFACSSDDDLPSGSDESSTQSPKVNPLDDPNAITEPLSEDYGLWKDVARDMEYKIYEKKMTWKEGGSTITANYTKNEDDHKVYKVSGTRSVLLKYTAENQAKLVDGKNTHILTRHGVNTAQMTGRLQMLPQPTTGSYDAEYRGGRGIISGGGTYPAPDYSTAVVKLINPDTEEVVYATVNEDGSWKAENLQVGIEYKVIVDMAGATRNSPKLNLVKGEDNQRQFDAEFDLTVGDQNATAPTILVQGLYSFMVELEREEDNYFYFGGEEYTSRLIISNVGVGSVSGVHFYIATLDEGIELLSGAEGIVGTMDPGESTEDIGATTSSTDKKEDSDVMEVKFKVRKVLQEKRKVRLQVIITGEGLPNFIHDVDINVYSSKFQVSIAKKPLVSGGGELSGFIVADGRNLVRFYHEDDWDYELGSESIKTIDLPCLSAETYLNYIMVLSATEETNEVAYSIGLDTDPDPALKDFIDTNLDEVRFNGNDTEADADALYAGMPTTKGFISYGTLDHYKFRCPAAVDLTEGQSVAGPRLKLVDIENEVAGLYSRIKVENKGGVNLGDVIGGLKVFTYDFDLDNDGFVDNDFACDQGSTTEPDGCLVPEEEAPLINDNCPGIYNPDQIDTDDDGVGDVCDASDTTDGSAQDESDNVPAIRGYLLTIDTAENEIDSDGDGKRNDEDNCPRIYNTGQANRENDDENDDNDETETMSVGDDGSVTVTAATIQGDACDDVPADDADFDSDGVEGSDDNCPSINNPDQENVDNDGQGDICEPDPVEGEVAGSSSNRMEFFDIEVLDTKCGYTGPENDLRGSCDEDFEQYARISSKGGAQWDSNYAQYMNLRYRLLLMDIENYRFELDGFPLTTLSADGTYVSGIIGQYFNVIKPSFGRQIVSADDGGDQTKNPYECYFESRDAGGNVTDAFYRAQLYNEADWSTAGNEVVTYDNGVSFIQLAADDPTKISLKLCFNETQRRFARRYYDENGEEMECTGDSCPADPNSWEPEEGTYTGWQYKYNNDNEIEYNPTLGNIEGEDSASNSARRVGPGQIWNGSAMENVADDAAAPTFVDEIIPDGTTREVAVFAWFFVQPAEFRPIGYLSKDHELKIEGMEDIPTIPLWAPDDEPAEGGDGSYIVNMFSEENISTLIDTALATAFYRSDNDEEAPAEGETDYRNVDSLNVQMEDLLWFNNVPSKYTAYYIFFGMVIAEDLDGEPGDRQLLISKWSINQDGKPELPSIWLGTRGGS